MDGGLLKMRKGASGGAFVRENGGDAVRAVLTDLYSLGTIQARHLIEVRLLIGVEVVPLASQRATDDEIEALARNVDEAGKAARAGDFPLRTAINLEFYRMLARMTRNPLLEILTDAVMALTLQFVEEFMRTSNATVLPFRRALLADLRAGDTDAAEARMRAHLLRLERIYLAEVARRRRQDHPGPQSVNAS